MGSLSVAHRAPGPSLWEGSQQAERQAHPSLGLRARSEGAQGQMRPGPPVHLGLASLPGPLMGDSSVGTLQPPDGEGRGQGLSSAMGGAGAPTAPRCCLPPSAWRRPRCPGMGVGGQASHCGTGHGGRSGGRQQDHNEPGRMCET